MFARVAQRQRQYVESVSSAGSTPVMSTMSPPKDGRLFPKETKQVRFLSGIPSMIVKTKRFLFKFQLKNFYDDNTYRCDHWGRKDYSGWKLEDGRFWFNHHLGMGDYDNSWLVANGEVNGDDVKEIRRLYDEAITRLMEEAFKLNVED